MRLLVLLWCAFSAVWAHDDPVQVEAAPLNPAEVAPAPFFAIDPNSELGRKLSAGLGLNLGPLAVGAGAGAGFNNGNLGAGYGGGISLGGYGIGGGFGGGVGLDGIGFNGGIGFKRPGQDYYSVPTSVYGPYQPAVYTQPIYYTVPADAAARHVGGGYGVQLGPVGFGVAGGLGPQGVRFGGGLGFSNQYQYYGTPSVYKQYYSSRPPYSTVAAGPAARHLGGGFGVQLGPIGYGYGAGLSSQGVRFGGGAGFSNEYQYYGTPSVYKQYYSAQPQQ